jgi:NAD(P)-dependent dehydrogenase (short-subunit alcohol dehydrogenase family)
VAAHTDGLGAVVNFAGLLDLGPLMEVSEERLRRVFDVNVIETHRVNDAIFDLVRAGGGRIVNISSESGRFRAGITTRPYAMTKHALEAYSDALRQELLFVGIPVIIIEADSRTPFRFRPGSPFEPIVAFTRRTSAREEKHARDPKILARAVYRAVTSRRPKPRYLVNGGMQSRIMDILPGTVADSLVKLGVDLRSRVPRSA